MSPRSNVVKSSRNYKNADWIKFNELLLTADWNLIFSKSTIDSIWEEILLTIQ